MINVVPDGRAVLVPDPLLSIQEQSTAISLPPATLPCLFTHQPPVESVRVYVYHNYCALQPSFWCPCCPAPPFHSMFPILARHDLSSPGSEKDRFAVCAPPSSLHACIPSVLRCPCCYHVPMCLLLTLFGRTYFITSLGLGVIISHSWLNDLTLPFCGS